MLDGFSSTCGKRDFCREASLLLITCTVHHETLPYQILQFYNLPEQVKPSSYNIFIFFFILMWYDLLH